jgi:hypothetical protein
MKLTKVKIEFLPKGIFATIRQWFCRHKEMTVKFENYSLEAKCSKCNKHFFETEE